MAFSLASAALGFSCFTLPFVLASWIVLHRSPAVTGTATGLLRRRPGRATSQ
jgi:urea transporter